jgi:protein-L-isoaspartate O-methyltransferase
MVIPLGPRDDQRINFITRAYGSEEYQQLLPVRFVPLVPRMVERASSRD